MQWILASSLGVASLGAQEFLTQEDVVLFYEQGYVLKKSCFSACEIAELNERVTEVIHRALEQVPEGAAEAYLDGSRIVMQQPRSIARINGCAGIDPALLETLRSEKMVRSFCALLGTRELEHIICQLHPKLPGDGVAYPKHRDIQFRKAFDPDWQDV